MVKLQIKQPIDNNIIKEKELLEKYPKIFRQKDLPMSQTCMCWGLACSEHWFPLLNILCEYIQNNIDEYKLPQLEADQIKEKFGSLRYYYSWKKRNPKCKLSEEEIKSKIDKIKYFIDFCELLSNYICESCGSMKDVFQTKGWIRTVCKECHEKEKIQEKEKQSIDKKVKTILG